jgi:hypothetical protein
LRAIREEWHRGARARVWIKRAGTASEFAAAQADLADLEAERGELAEAMGTAPDIATRQQLRDELRVVEGRVRSLEARVNDMRLSRDELRKLEPQFVDDQAREVHHSAEYRDLQVKIAAIEQRLARLAQIAPLDVRREADRQQAAQHARRWLYPEHPAYPVAHSSYPEGQINPQAWADYVDDEKFQATHLRTELATLKQARSRMEAEAVDPVAWHVRKFGL